MSSFESHPQEPSLGHPFTVAVLEVDLRLHGCHSLKDKRGRLARVVHAIEKSRGLTLREVGEHDIWGRAALATVTLSTDYNLAVRALEAVADDLMRAPDVELVAHDIYER